MWMINRLSMITWQILIRRDRAAASSPAIIFICNRVDWLWIFGCEQRKNRDSIQVFISRRGCFFLVSALERGDGEWFLLNSKKLMTHRWKELDTDKELKDLFTQITKISSLPLARLHHTNTMIISRIPLVFTMNSWTGNRTFRDLTLAQFVVYLKKYFITYLLLLKD